MPFLNELFKVHTATLYIRHANYAMHKTDNCRKVTWTYRLAHKWANNKQQHITLSHDLQLYLLVVQSPIRLG